MGQANLFLPLILLKQPTIVILLKSVTAFLYNSITERGIEMQIEVKIDASYTEPKIVILTASMTEDINAIIHKLSQNTPPVISGSKNQKLEVIEQDDLIRIYANSGKVFAVTSRGEYTVRFRLYEMEERLNPKQFVRISNSEIINLKQVNNFDLSFSGTICVEFTDGTSTYVSRRYVSKLKKILGI